MSKVLWPAARAGSAVAAFLCIALAGPAGAYGAHAAKPKVSHCKTSNQKVLRVGTYDGKKGQCATISEAVEAVKPGGWVLIAPGDYKEATVHEIEGAYGDDRAGASVLVKTANVHVRGMNRNTVVIDGTKPGSPQCASSEADQNFGLPEGEGFAGNNGIIVDKASGVSLQNFTACNFLASNAGGDAIWFDGGGSSGHQDIGDWTGEYLSATSTFWGGKTKPHAEYGIYASNTFGPGIFDHTYAGNMADSGYYIGACPDCKAVIDNSKAEGNDLGYSGSNSGGHLVIENSEFADNEEGVATQSQNNDDAPSPQDGICPEGKENPSPPAIAQRKDICWVMTGNRVVDNNNGATPTNSSAPGLVGTGMTIAGGRDDLVVDNTFEDNKAWGILELPYPGVEESPPPQIPPEDNCKGGKPVEAAGKSECIYEPFANEVAGNTFAENGGYGNPSNGDIGEVADPEPTELANCWHGNVERGGGEPSSEPKLIQVTHGTCSSPDSGGEPLTSVLAVQATCDSQLLAECPSVPGEEYPRSSEVKLLPLPEEATMPDPCEGVPADPWCPRR